MTAAVALVRCEPSLDELRAAWTRIHRASWPPTFEEAMADPIRSRLVRMNALHPPRPRVVLFDRRPAPREAHSLSLPGVAPGHVDVKRLAAGDRDD